MYRLKTSSTRLTHFSQVILLAVGCLGLYSVKSQPLMTPDQAVEVGLKSNFGLKLSLSKIDIARNNRQTGMGPFLPGVSASARQSGDLAYSNNQTTLGASVNAELFNGFQNYHGYRQLEYQELAAKLSAKAEVQNTVEAILNGYYSIVRLKQGILAIRELISVSEARAKLAEAKLEVGAGTRLEQLQSLADLNTDSSTYLDQLIALSDAKIKLNQLLARETSFDFEVIESIPLTSVDSISRWETELSAHNPTLQLAEAQKSVAELGLKSADGGYWPSLNAGINYSSIPWETPSNQRVASQRGDWTYGLNLTIPIFDKLSTRREVTNARIALRQQELSFYQTRQTVFSDFAVAKQRYQIGIQQVALEERNLKVAQLQAEAARERFKVGSWSALEFRDAQTQLLNTRTRLIAARLSAKQAELVMQRLVGRLDLAYPEGQ